MMRRKFSCMQVFVFCLRIFIGIIVSPAMANYQSQEGRWLQQEKLGMMIDAEDFQPINQYDDSLNTYQAFNFSPQVYMDPTGLYWAVERNGGSQAMAMVIISPRTISELANIIGLNAFEFREWLTYEGIIRTMKGRKTKETLELSDEICPMQSFGIPNTMLTYWAGELGDFGKGWVNWKRDVSYLQKLGFATDYREGWTALEFETYLSEKTLSGELHGIFFWGHGYQAAYTNSGGKIIHKWWDGLITDHYKFDSLAKNKIDGDEDIYRTSYKGTWPVMLKYKLGLGLIYACGGAHARMDNFSYNSLFWGPSGVMWPIGTPAVSATIKPGDQGTRRK